MRKSLSLDGVWTLVPDRANGGKAAGWPRRGFPRGAERHLVRVPSVWQRYLPGYHGVAFYETTFTAPPKPRPRAVVRIGAANYRAEGWLNGLPVGTHEGGYTPFAWDVTSAIRRGRRNRFVVRIVHSPPGEDLEGTGLERVPSSKETWYFPYAGIWGAVELGFTSDPWIDRLAALPLGGKAERVRVRATVRGSGAKPFSGALTIRLGRAAAELPVSLGPGTPVVELDRILPADGLPRWTPRRPILHRVTATLSSGRKTVDRRDERFGLRTLDFRDGRLLLNGEPLKIRGVLLQPNHPVSLVSPPDRESALREMEKIKACGFNLVRSHLKHLTDEQLDWCDTHGLLVYEETPLAWMNEPDGDIAWRTAAREIEEMIQAHLNHPSIVLWGIANENGRFAGALGERLLRLCAGLDPSRPAIDVSGWSMNIYPKGGWMNETHLIRPGSETPEFIEDHHHYLRTPASDADRWFLRTLGRPDRMPSYEEAGYGPAGRNEAWKKRLGEYGRRGIFVSEFGVGGLPDLDLVLKGFAGFRAREKGRPRSSPVLLDEGYYRRIGESLKKSFARRGLAAEFGSLAGFVRAAQEQQAQGVRRQMESLSHNSRVSGYVLTQWNDVSWECDAGVVDVWRRPKLVARELKRLNSPWVLAVRFYERMAKPGTPRTAFFMIEGPAALPARALFEYRVLGPGRRTAGKWMTCSPVMDEALAIEVQPPAGGGRWLLQGRVRISGRTIAVVEEPLYDGDWTDASRGPFALLGENAAVKALYGPRLVPAEHANTIVVPDAPAAGPVGISRLLERVAEGRRAIFLDLDESGAEALNRAPGFPWELKLVKTMCTFQGIFHYFRKGPLSAGLPGIGADEPTKYIAGELYASLLPVWSLGEIEGAIIHAGSAGTDKLGFEEGFSYMDGWHADIMEIPHGKGKVVFCQYRLFPKSWFPYTRNPHFLGSCLLGRLL